MLCHLLFLVPLLGLGLFLFLPFWTALPWYALSLVVSALAFYRVIEDRKIQARNGPEGLVDVEGVVVRGGEEPVVRCRNELWRATALGPLAKGTRVRIVGVEGMKLSVLPLKDGP